MNARDHQAQHQGPHFESTVVAGPWPSYSQYRHIPERDRWVMYAFAKRQRDAMQDAGFQFAESYDQFIARVTRELEI